MEPMAIVAVVMLAAGILGGLINLFISTNEDSAKMPWWQHIIIGVGASFMVPLFLNMISSGLINEILGSDPSKTKEPSKLFVLAGFSLVAAVSSRAFIKTVSDRVLQEAKEAKAEAQAARTQATMALDLLDEKEDLDAVGSLGGEGKVHEMTEPERKVLFEMNSGRFSMRSLGGLSRNTDLDKDEVNTAISGLMNGGFVEQGLNSKGQPRWYPSSTGRVAVAKIRN